MGLCLLRAVRGMPAFDTVGVGSCPVQLQPVTWPRGVVRRWRTPDNAVLSAVRSGINTAGSFDGAVRCPA